MIYGYIRVSTRSQLEGNGLEVQKNAILNKYPDAIIVQEQFSAKTMDRPKFNELIKELKENDKLVVHKLDRMSRTTLDGMKLMERLIQEGVEVEVLNFGQVVGGFNSSNKLMFQILMAFAEYERDCIVERTQAGKEIAKQNPDFREGRPVIYTESRKKHALELLKSGKTYREVEKDTGISKSTLIRYKRIVEQEKIAEEILLSKQKEIELESKKAKQVKKIKTNREKIINKLSSMNLILGCYDNLVDKLTSYQLKKVLDALPFASTDVQVSINKKKYVVEINEVDNEIDFEVIDIDEYVSRYGELED